MYQGADKKFNHKSLALIEKDLVKALSSGLRIQRVFLADGDVMTLSVRRLEEILKTIRQYIPNIQRISAYCLPRNLRHKSVADLESLHSLGLKLLYVGCETGDDELLKLINKGESYQSSLDALQKISGAGMKSSVMILNGLGGPTLSKQHALNSARLMNEAQPNYLSTLVVNFPLGMKRFQDRFPEYRPLNQQELFSEMLYFLNQLELEQTIFRSDHVSNSLVLKGVLNKDKQRLIGQVELAINHPEQSQLRGKYQRGL